MTELSVSTPRAASRTSLLAALCGLALAATAAQAQQVYTEVEPNNNKATANVVPFLVSPGDQITGTTTGAATSTAGLTSVDYYKLDLATAAPGIYRQRLVMTSPNAGATYAGTIRGLDINDAGQIDPASDVSAVFSTSALQYVQWYGFGKGEEFYFRIERNAGTTTQPYTVTLERTAATVQDATTTFATGPITISSVGLPATNTDFWVYDSNFDPVPTFGNEDSTPIGGGPAGAGSHATRILAPGTYYVAISTFNLANNQPPPYDDPASSIANVWEFPGGVSNSASSSGIDVSFRITDDAGNSQLIGATKQNAFDVVFVRFQVGATPDPVGVPSPAAGTLVTPGTSVVLSVAVTPAASAITGVTADLTGLGGAASVALLDNGTGGDAVAGDNIYSVTHAVPYTQAPGYAAGTFRITDAAGRDGTGRFVLRATPVVPLNDTCAGATNLTGSAFPRNIVVGNNQATNDQDISCNSTATAVFNGVWYTITPSQNILFTVDESSSSTTLYAALFVGGCGNPAEFDCRGSSSPITFFLTAGTQYHLLLGRGSASTSSDPDTVLNLQFSSATPPPPPSNDDCANATVIPAAGPFPYTNTVGIGGALGDIATECAIFSPNGVWYSYTPAVDTLASFAETGPEFGRISLFRGTCPPAEGFDVYCDTIANSIAATSATKFPLLAGSTYYFLLNRQSGAAAADATFMFAFNTEPLPNVPNRDCELATVISLPASGGTYDSPVFPAVGALEDRDVSCNSSFGGNFTQGGAWWTYTPAVDVRVAYQQSQTLPCPTPGCASIQSVIAFFEGGCGGAQIACTTNDGFDDLIDLRAGVTYSILVGREFIGSDYSDIDGTDDNRALRLTAIPLTPPANDLCQNARVITGTSFSDTVSNYGATNDTETSCSAGTITTTTRHGVWYRYTSGPGGGTATLTESTAQDTVIAVFTGDCAAPTEAACIDNSADSGTFVMSPHTTYLILVGRRSDTFPAVGDQISFSFSVEGGGCPADFNVDGIVNVSDIFAFLSAWFSETPGSDFNGSGTVDVSDIFAFLSAWFTGCD